MFTIRNASPDDGSIILAIQKRAFETEARVCDQWEIAPLLETLDSVLDHIHNATVLAATKGGRVVGSIRGVVTDDICMVKSLSIEPDLQGHGIGSALLDAIEEAHPEASGFQLLTNRIMEDNVRFYLRHGYTVTDTIPHSDKITLVSMGKQR
ncbi:MAG: GNAT family N-acetyltransferase [Betaproteobacteria bacterium]